MWSIIPCAAPPICLAGEAVCSCGACGDHFRGAGFIAESGGYAHFRDETMALGGTSTRQISGHTILTLSEAADAATCSSGHQWMVRCDPWNVRNSSSIIPKPPPYVARLAMSPTALADSRPPSAPCAQFVATGVRPVRALFGMMLPKWPTRLGSPVKLAWEAGPAPRGAHRDALRGRGEPSACSTPVWPCV